MPYQNLIHLRKQIICDVLNWKSTENLIEEHRKKFDEFTIAGIEFWFDGFKSKFQNTNNFLVTEELERIASETWFTPENVLQFLVLIDVIKNKSIKASYKSLCDIIGYPIIDVTAHEYWYQQFVDGSRDFNYPPEFLDLPIDIIQRLVDELNFKEQQILRGVCRGLRSLIDDRRPPLRYIEYHSTVSGTVINIEGRRVMYCDRGDRKTFRSLKIINDTKFNDRAFSDLARFLKNPKIRLDTFYIGMPSLPVFCEKLLKIVHKIHNFHVENMQLNGHSFKFCVEFLKSLKPGTLESIKIYNQEPSKRWKNLKELVDLEQWKHAKHVVLQYSIHLKIEHFLHFESFRIKIKKPSVMYLRKMKDMLLKTPNFQFCWMETCGSLPVDDIIEELNLEWTLQPQYNNDEYYILSDKTFVFIIEPQIFCICR